MSILLLFICGALGAIAKDVVEDNKLKLPEKVDGNFCLGFLGGCITGGAVGMLVDGSPVTAFLAGYSGTSAIENLILKPATSNATNKEIIKGLIRYIAKQESVDPDLAVRVAECESSINPVAKHLNDDGSCDRGLFQINNKWHPEVSDEDAYDIVKSTRFFCKAFKEGRLEWWNATKSCWKK